MIPITDGNVELLYLLSTLFLKTVNYNSSIRSISYYKCLNTFYIFKGFLGINEEKLKQIKVFFDNKIDNNIISIFEFKNKNNFNLFKNKIEENNKSFLKNINKQKKNVKLLKNF